MSLIRHKQLVLYNMSTLNKSVNNKITILLTRKIDVFPIIISQTTTLDKNMADELSIRNLVLLQHSSLDVCIVGLPGHYTPGRATMALALCLSQYIQRKC